MNESHQQASTTLLEVNELCVCFHGQTQNSLDRVSLNINEGSITGLVGASGAGKSSLARAIMGLIKTDAGEIRFRGEKIPDRPQNYPKSLRQGIQMVFQEPSASLSPRRTIGQSLLEPMRHFGLGDNTYQQEKIRSTLHTVGLDEDITARYPHQFSSGQQQRIAIARALVTNPDLLIADEAVSSLDVSIQAQILQLIKTLQKEHNIAVLFISHDLGAVAQVADDIALMFAGQLLEQSPASSFFSEPAHPYGRQLLALARDASVTALSPWQWRLRRGSPATTRSQACVFSEHCQVKLPVCEQQDPPVKNVGIRKGHTHSTHCVKCHLHDEESIHDR